MRFSHLRKILKPLFPRKLRNQLIVMAICMVSIPVLTMGYVVDNEGRAALIAEKEKKLMAVTRLLDAALGDTFNQPMTLPRSQQITALNHQLSDTTEHIAQAFPGIGAGYYHRKLDAIITYAPQVQYKSNVGVTIAPEHPGRAVMASREPRVYSGKQVRGHILNAMIPIVRHGEVQGYIWANELSEDISLQAERLDWNIVMVLSVGLLLSLLLIVLASRRFSASIDVITHGLDNLAQDHHTRLPELPGEMGKISHSVNMLAQTLRETQTLNDLIIENAADGVIAVDKQGRVTTMNPAAEHITGYSLQELLGKPYSSIFIDTGFDSPVLETLQQGTGHVALEISFPARERTIEISVTTSQIHNARGELIGALVIFSDLTARKESQRRLAQTERLATLGELMAGVAHEVRNPLTAIKGYAQILKQHDLQPAHQQYLAVILKEIDSINRVIQQLLDFARPRRGLWQPVHLNQLLDECLVLIQTSGLEARIHFASHYDSSLPPIDADGELLKQVLLNILINAVQAISARGNITIRTLRWDDAHQAIAIQDDGCGIAPEHQKKIFDPFFTTKASGTGLGLALSQRIINAHHGDIQLVSQPGHGATFTLILPLHFQGTQPL